MNIPDYAYDDDLFALNPQAFGSYLEPNRWDELNAMKRVGDKQVASRCPATDALARALDGDVAQRRQWGYQLAHGGWATVTEGESLGRFLVEFDDRVRGGEGSYWAEPRAKPLSYKELRRALIGRSLAVGATDRPVADRYGVARAERATCLRIDTDLDEAWLYERHDAVIGELRAQERAVNAMGLPFLAFRTGGRGVQAIVRLPAPLCTAAASLLSRGLRMALRGRAGLAGVHVDRDAFDGLMRLPGGIHHSGRTALFVDVDRGRLHPVSMQAALLSDCLAATSEEGRTLGAQQSLAAELALLPDLRRVLGSAWKVASESDVLHIVGRAPSNPLCRGVLDAHRALGVPFGRQGHRRAGRPPLASGAQGPLSACDRAWAEGVWSMDVEPGEYWEWVHMRGHRGMLAAVVLFGEDRALDRLQEKASSHRAANARDQREREHVNVALWKSFGLKGFVPRALRAAIPTPYMAGKTSALARSIAARTKAASSGSKWSLELLEHVVGIVLAAIEESAEGEARLSVRDIVRLVNSGRAENRTNIARVHGALARVCATPGALHSVPTSHQELAATPLVPAFVRVGQCRVEGERSLYLPGPAIYGSHVHRKFWQGTSVI